MRSGVLATWVVQGTHVGVAVCCCLLQSGAAASHSCCVMPAYHGVSNISLTLSLLLTGQDVAFAWVCDHDALSLLEVLDDLANFQRGWRAWLSDRGNKVHLFNQILQHGLLGWPVSRTAIIPAANSTTVPWQDAENAGVCVLVNHGEHWAVVMMAKKKAFVECIKGAPHCGVRASLPGPVKPWRGT